MEYWSDGVMEQTHFFTASMNLLPSKAERSFGLFLFLNQYSDTPLLRHYSLFITAGATIFVTPAFRDLLLVTMGPCVYYFKMVGL